jgi:hypothetical protein
VYLMSAGDERQLSLLAGRPGWRGAEQGCDQGFVVCKKAKAPPLQQKPKVSDRAESIQQLSVEG